MDGFSEHRKKLENLCRVCGSETTSKHRYCKNDFYHEFGELFGIELNFDNVDTHPQFVCGKDANVFYRFRQAKSSKKSFTTDMLPVIFPEHPVDSYCSICSGTFVGHVSGKRKAPVGRPKKTKICCTQKIHKEFPGNFSKSISGEVVSPSSRSIFSTVEYSPEKFQETINLVDSFCATLTALSHEEKNNVFKCLLEKMNVEDRCVLAYQMGFAESDAVRTDASSFSLMYKDLEQISNFHTEHWLKQRNPVLSNFICGIGKISDSLDTLKHEKSLVLASTVENAYKLNYVNLISPFSFLQNICIYSLTGSKIATDLIGRAKPSGGYKSMVNWLFEQGSQEPLVESGDLFNVFDNEQVVGRKSGIKPKNKAKVSIITNKGYVQLDSHGNLQMNENLKPTQILKLKEVEHGVTQTSATEFKNIVNEMIHQEKQLYNNYKALHYEQLCYFVDGALKIVLEEQISDGIKIIDNIDQNIESEQFHGRYTKCANCGMINTRRKQICIGCKGKEGLKLAKALIKDKDENLGRKSKEPTFRKLSFELNEAGNINITQSSTVERHERYDHVKTNHRNKKEVILTDPVYCNPNSFENVALVLRQIGIENGISRYNGNARHWTFICCDGVPYMICKKLKEEAVVCTIDDCNETFLSKHEFSGHCKEDHPVSYKRGVLTFIYEFDWFYLRIGAGHYEMNLIKSFFELNWIPILEKLCEEMGFTSDAAKLYAKNCKDHHKSWNLILIFHFSALRELVLPFIRHALQQKVDSQNITAKKFFIFAHELCQKSANYKYLLDQVSLFSQGIINFRMGIRRNNAELMHSAKFMTKELFHGRTHPKYQQIELYDHIQYLLMPDSVRDLSDEFVSITTSGNPSNGEDFDFILEEKNRQLKQWISKGVPTDAIWQKICRNNIILEKIKQNTYDQFGISTGDNHSKTLELEVAIKAFRVTLRKSEYFDKAKKLESLTGRVLDDDLLSFADKANHKRIYCLKNAVLQEDVDDLPCMSNPVPITPEERSKLEDINNMTKLQIEREILNFFELITDPELYDYYAVQFQQKVKGQKKANYVSFHSELKTLFISNSENDVILNQDDIQFAGSEVTNVTAEEAEELKDLVQSF